jgi:hypothetical protein
MTALNERPGRTPRLQTPPVCLDHAEPLVSNPSAPQRVHKVGYTVNEWCHAAGLGRSKLYEMIADGAVQSVTVGRRRIITTTPADFLAALAGGTGA